MALTKSMRIYVLYIHLVLIHLVEPQVKAGVYFKLIKGTKKERNSGDVGPFIQKDFFQCARTETCTHLLQLANEYMIINGSEELGKRKKSAVQIYEKVKTKGNSSPLLNANEAYRRNKSTIIYIQMSAIITSYLLLSLATEWIGYFFGSQISFHLSYTPAIQKF